MSEANIFEVDAMSGVSVELPYSLSLKSFSYARQREIEIMKKSILSCSSTKLVFQKLPKHMRRRAMSHNVKRLPRRLREIHLSQMKKSGLPPKQKRPSRKYRRKPKNLLEEFSKKQSRIKWLSTHVWHAKRFHMIEKWGYKLPYGLCDKSFKACYRATKSYCLLQDISYFHCIEINGNENVIIEGFKNITNENYGLTIKSKAFLDGNREGEVMLFNFSSNSTKPIGKVNFLWKNKNNINNDRNSSLWLWVHVAFYNEVLNTLLDCFNLTPSENEFYASNDKSIQLIELKTQLNRFRLIGDLSNSIITSCFKIYEQQNDRTEWHESFYNSNKQLINEQNNFWEQLKTIPCANLLSSHIILPIIIHDPRLNSLVIREKSKLIFNPNIINQSNTCPLVRISPLWEENLRKTINSSKVSNSEIITLRGSVLDSTTDLTNFGKPVPMILVQSPGNREDTLGYSSGWDIILPAAWAQPIWCSLIMHGARSGGLREFQQNAFEMSKPDFLYPDTAGGITEEQNITDDCLKTFFRLPPNKRTNFKKFKITSPFNFNWKLLIENWLNHTIDTFFVLRDKKMLNKLRECFALGKKENISLPDNCLVPIQIDCSRGTPKRFAIICIPNKEDLKKAPVENKCIDPNQEKRKMLRNEHKKLLKSLRQKRKKSKKLGKPIDPVDMENLVQYSKQMKKLWIPDTEEIKHSCSREVIGFVKDGGFSLVLGKTKGIGYIAGAAVNSLLNKEIGNKVLFRNTNSRQYFLTKLSVLVNI